jgi:hypothetical protein
MTGDRAAVALAVTVHETDERLVGMIEAHLPALVARYAALTALCSQETHPTVLALLRDHRARLGRSDVEPRGILNIGDVRRETVRLGLSAGTSHLQMCDFDRALHWVAHYLDELEAVTAEIPRYDLLVLGRTPRAWATHPPYQAETEPLFNRVFALVTGLDWDVGAGSRGLSRRVVERLLATSQELTVGVDAEWPLLALSDDSFRVGYRACEGLEFETADRFGPEIAAAGGYSAWEAQVSADPRRWVYRLQIALRIAEASVRYGGHGGS